MHNEFHTLADCIGNTPLIRLQRLGQQNNNILLVKLEGNNPAGSVKDRPALSMINAAELRGDIKPGDTLVEATSGNTGIALAMVAAIKGYSMCIIMPEKSTKERKDSMAAYGAKLILTDTIEEARDLAMKMHENGEAKLLNQFANQDNPNAHYHGTGAEIWQQTKGKVTHFISSMGTTGTIMGVSTYLKEQNPNIKVIGLQPDEDSSIPGIRRWPKEYMPTIFDASKIDQLVDISQEQAENCMRELARQEGIFCGISSGAAISAMLQLSSQVHDSVMVAIVCDRGDRYLSSGIFAK